MPQVLMIEGDRFLADICERHLREAGFEFIHAHHGEEGVMAATKHLPDVIVLAIALSKKDGFQVLEELKSNDATKHIPVIIFSNLGSKEDVDRCLNVGACEYMIKSQHTPEELVARVKNVILPL